MGKTTSWGSILPPLSPCSHVAGYKHNFWTATENDRLRGALSFSSKERLPAFLQSTETIAHVTFFQEFGIMYSAVGLIQAVPFTATVAVREVP